MFLLIEKKNYWVIKQMHSKSFGELIAFNSDGRIKCVSLKKGPCQARPKIFNINSNETLFDRSTVQVNKCGGSCDWFSIHLTACSEQRAKLNARGKWKIIFSLTWTV